MHRAPLVYPLLADYIFIQFKAIDIMETLIKESKESKEKLIKVVNGCEWNVELRVAVEDIILIVDALIQEIES